MNRVEIEQRVRAGVRRGLDEAVIALQREMRLTLSKPGTGRLYRIGKGKKSGRNLRARGYHRASAPGQPPAVNTGNLRRSWQAGRAGSRVDRSRVNDPLRPTIRLGSVLVYAKPLEYGTRRMAARPYAMSSRNRLVASGQINRIMSRQIARALRP